MAEWRSVMNWSDLGGATTITGTKLYSGRGYYLLAEICQALIVFVEHGLRTHLGVC